MGGRKRRIGMVWGASGTKGGPQCDGEEPQRANALSVTKAHNPGSQDGQTMYGPQIPTVSGAQQSKVYAVGDWTRKNKRRPLDILGSPMMQTTRVDDLRVHRCQILQPRWSILYGPGNHMPIGGYKITKTTIEGVETDARTVLAMS